MGPADAAAEALRLATVDPDRALAVAAAVVDEARRSRDWSTVSRASRAAGLAALQLRDLPAAAVALRRAIGAADRAGDGTLLAEARMTLAATLAVGGSTNRALAEIDAALAATSGVVAARARVQRATVLQSAGRFDDALAEYRSALPVLRRERDVEWETRALSNRSVLLTKRRVFAAAELDLRTVQRLSAANGLPLAAAYAEQNLGCLLAGQGRVVAALEAFDAASDAYGALNVQVGSLLIDRGEVLLSVRLVEEARAAADTAVTVLRSQRRRAELPEALLLQSTAALLAGDPAAALGSARAAAAGFSRLGRVGAVALARHAALQAQMELAPAAVGPARARRIADDLERAGWRVPALEARVLAGRLALSRGDLPAAHRDLGDAARARRSGPADCRARAWLAEALLRRAEGNRRGAASALSAGLRVVEDYQATLGATELRAHVSVHRGSLARLGLRMAVEDRSARRVLSWAERGRVSALLMRAPAPPDDDVLAQALADLRTTVREIEERLHAGRPADDLMQRQLRLERQVADIRRRLPPDGVSTALRPTSCADLATALGDAALVEYLQLDDTVFAVTLVDGRAAFTELGPAAELADRLGHLGFALRRIGRLGAGRGAAAVGAVLTTVTEGLDARLLAPLRGLLDDRPLVVAPTGVLQSLPWALLPSCAGRPVVVTPSATLWWTAATRPRPAAGGPVVSVAGPGLPGARGEAAAVAELYPGSVLLVDDAATIEGIRVADGASLVHVAAHGLLRSDNPLYSALLLADGPLLVYDLEHLTTAPDHVVLAACDTARMQVLPGDEVLGFGSALLVQGTSSVVAPLLPVPDAATAALMTAYHRRLIAGRSPAEALAEAQAAMPPDDPVGRAAAAAFVCVGAGGRRVEFQAFSAAQVIGPTTPST